MEMLDIYSTQGKPTGRCTERGNYKDLGPDDRILIVHICLFNKNGQMLIQQRQADKKFPLCWDLSAGGHVQSGETGLQAVLRELREELGITFEEKEIHFAFTEPFHYILDNMYLCRCDIPAEKLHLQSSEVADAKWASFEEVLDLRRRDSFVDYELKLLQQLFDEGKLL